MPGSKSQKYVSVQVLRGLAAMLVVLLHSMESARDHIGSKLVLYSGAAGVDIFFAISGFIMVVTTAHSWGAPGAGAAFIKRRLIRLVPLYWIATTFRLLLLISLPHLVRLTKLHLWHTVASFLFIPAWNFEHLPVPVLPVGWTLSYELFFYVLFAVGLVLSDRPIRWATGLLLLSIAIGYFRGPSWGAPTVILNSVLLEFIFGMAIGYATLSGFRVNAIFAKALFVVSLLALLVTDIGRAGSPPRVIVWGIPAAFILLASVSLEERVREPFAGLPTTLGDASYAIYLFHIFTIEGVWVVLDKLRLTPRLGAVIPILICTALSAFVGVYVHYYIERPSTDFLRSKLRSRRLRQAPSVA